jgi:hypothetical protein
MCNTNVPSVNLQTAVLMQVQEFVNSGQAFSRYDITKALRLKCNDGLLEIPEVENVNPGSIRYDIRKASVDAIFDQLWQNCLANGLPPLRYDFNQNTGYRIFSVDVTAGPVPTQTPTPVPTSPVPTPSNGYVSAPAQASTVPTVASVRAAITSLTDSEIRRRVTLYMDASQKVGRKPTLKQIQSAIKRGNKSTGLSYREIANVVSSLGYKTSSFV